MYTSFAKAPNLDPCGAGPHEDFQGVLLDAFWSLAVPGSAAKFQTPRCAGALYDSETDLTAEAC